MCTHYNYSHTGRPPWYDAQGQIMDAFVIGLSGGSASGKTTVARKVIESLGVPWVTLLSMDSFYKVLTEEQHEMAAKNEYNFDHPGKCSNLENQTAPFCSTACWPCNSYSVAEGSALVLETSECSCSLASYPAALHVGACFLSLTQMLIK